jgi:hypothetical protein
LAVLLFFNELSCSAPQPKARVDEAMEQFARLLTRITAWRRDTALISAVRLKEMELAPGYYLAEWAGQPRHIDFWRAIRRMQNRAPFNAVLPPGAAEGVDYLWTGRAAEALGAAHLSDGLLVSLLVDASWNASWIRAHRRALAEAPDGGPVILEETVDVRHAATLHHAAVHEDWVRRTGIPDLRRGAEIWAARGDLFPRLLFLPRVEGQLRELRLDWVIPAAYELRRLDAALADWDPQQRREPMWRSKVTPEAQMRKPLCAFADVDGVERIFDLHGRFTPGAGRVYFRLVPDSRQAAIAHIGLKLGI